MSKILDGIIGFTVGDSIGVPVEFKSREELKQNPVKDMIGNGTYNMPIGSWSDDTSMTLATLDSIIENKNINTNDMANKFLRWYRKSEYTPTGKIFDIGDTTLRALSKYELKLDEAKRCGGTNKYDNGNGSLMRMLPIAYYIYYKNIKDDIEIYNIVKEVSSITHAHEISILGCYIYIKYIIELLNGNDKNKAYSNIKKIDYGLFQNETIEDYNRILEQDIEKFEEKEISSQGYVVSTLEAVLWLFLNSTDYNETILKAVNLGNDTDTVGAITGSLLGLYYGIDNIKEEWKNKILKYNYIIDLCNKFEKVF